MHDEQIDIQARILWGYLQLHETPAKSDIIFCLCSHDTRVAVRAAQLMLDGLGDYLVFSGGAGRLTKDIFSKPEADIFAGIAQEMGVKPEKVIIENQSTNTGENLRFTYKILKKKDIKATTILLVQKPYMERRTYATFKKQWPNSEATIQVTSPQVSYEEYLNDGTSKERILNLMVGDMQRIREYPKQGFQIEQDIPASIWDAYNALVKLGFTKHLL